MGDYEAAPYYILDQHTRVPEILLASAAVKASVSPEDWAIVEECAKATQEFEIAAWAAKEKSSEEIVRAAGTTVVELTPEQRAEFEAKMAPLYDQYAANYADVIAQIKAIGEKF
jgi:TRAP-type C4-dicarboxylate transport system substrate-binding protein